MSVRSRVLRWTVPVDDQAHVTNAAGPVLRVAGDRKFSTIVEFWTLESAEAPPRGARPRVVRVFGTGQPVPAGYEWLGTAERTEQGLVWHLFERTADPSPGEAAP